MFDWWRTRTPRERLVLGVAGILLAVMLYYLMIWEPLVQGAEKLAQEKQQASELHLWLSAIEPELEQLRGAGGTPSASKGSVLSIADSSAKSGGLSDAIKRMQPEGDNTVRVWLEKASFNTMLAWLRKLEQQHAIQATDLSISRENEPGHVNARLTLER